MTVLLVRADGIGDALVCAPLVAALAAAGHRLGAVLGTGNRAIFAPATFAAVHVLERVPWPAHGSTPRSRAVALAGARALGYDVALIASEEPEAYAFARAAGIPERVGFHTGWGKPFKSLAVRATLTRAVARTASARRVRGHEAETMFALGTSLVNEVAPTRDLARLRAVVLGEPVARHGAIVVQVSRKFARSGLDGGAFAALARALVARGAATIVAGDETALVCEVAAASGAAARPGLDVPAWKAALAGARAVVAADSGAVHVAGMLGVPVVDLFAPTRATAYDVLRWAPWAAPYRALVLDPSRTAAQTAARAVAALDDLLAGEPAA